MSDETFSIVAFLSIIASAVVLWSSFRRRQLLRRLRESIERDHPGLLDRKVESDDADD